MTEPPPHESLLRRTLLWLIGLRLAVACALLGPAIMARLEQVPDGSWDPLVAVLGATGALSVVYLVALTSLEKHRWLLALQFACDATFVSIVVWATGGVGSSFSSVYVLPVLAASILRLRRGGLIVALLSAAMYVGVVALQYRGVPDPAGGWYVERVALPPVQTAAFGVMLNVSGFLGVALLTGYLAEGLRRADARLERASSEIADLQAYYEHAINSLPSGLVTTDTRGRVLTFNRGAEAITGYAAAGVIGRAVDAVLKLPPDFTARGEDTPGSVPERLEYPYPLAPGRTIEIGLSTAPLLTPGGRAGFLYTFQDVTELKKLEREAQTQQRLAAVGEMAAGIAHEIRNPLASMSGSIQVLRQELPLTPEQEQLMDIVLRESERLNETIASFLAYARPQRLSTARVDVRRVLSDAATLLRNSAECGEDHAIDVEVPSSEVWFESDEAQIRQVVWNLATNGLRAMPRGGQLLLSAGIESSGSAAPAVRLSVQDHGVGIASEELDAIFQPFRGAFNQGTGLGLAIVHRIVSDYGGEIEVTSQPGVGTTVSIRLPVKESLVASTGSPGHQRTGSPGLQSTGSPGLQSRDTVDGH